MLTWTRGARPTRPLAGSGGFAASSSSAFFASGSSMPSSMASRSSSARTVQLTLLNPSITPDEPSMVSMGSLRRRCDKHRPR